MATLGALFYNIMNWVTSRAAYLCFLPCSDGHSPRTASQQCFPQAATVLCRENTRPPWPFLLFFPPGGIFVSNSPGRLQKSRLYRL